MSATLTAPAGSPHGGAPGLPSALTALAALPRLPTDGEGTLAADIEGGKPDMEHAQQLLDWSRSINIADELPDDQRREIAQRVLREYNLDEESRAEWREKYDRWLDFAMQITQPKTYPWPQSSNVIYPLITSASLQFAARAYPAVIRDRDVVKGAINGPDDGTPAIDPSTGQPAMQPGPPGPDGQPQPVPVWQVAPGDKKKRADRIGEHMSWQLLEEQPEWEPQTDALLVILPIVGTMFRKTYFDPSLQRNVSETVTAAQLCVNYKAKSFETAPRHSEIVDKYPHEIETMIRSGVFLDEEYGQNQDAGQDEDAFTTFIEQHRRLDLDDDGYPEPYIVTVARDSGKLARIKAAYDFEGVMFSGRDHRVVSIQAIPFYTKYGFIPSPVSGVYDVGFGHLLFPINEAINSSLNQMFDAGHLANAGGGFIGSGLSMNTGAVRFQVGEYKPVNNSGGSIRENVFPIPFPGPNPVLFSLLQFLVEAGKEVAAIKDVMVGDLPGDNTSGVATLAMIEQGLSVFSAIYKRVHRSLKKEFLKLFRLNRIYLPVESGYRRGDEWKFITQRDYQEGAGVEPVSDPKMVTDMQKLGRAQFLMQFKDDSWFKPREIRLKMLDAALFPDADDLLVPSMPPNPEIAGQVAELQLQKETLDLRAQDLHIRAANEQAERAIAERKAVPENILRLAQAVNQLAQAKKADSEADQGWYDLQLAALKHDLERLNAGVGSDVAGITAAAGGGGTPGGATAGAVPHVAAPAGQPPVPAVPPGLPWAGGG